MSFFSLFGNKTTRSSERLPEHLGLDDDGSSQPTPSGSDRKSLRLTQRELLYSTVKDVMIRAGVLAASYRFKVLSLDAQGRQYLIMMDLLKEGIGELKGLVEIESQIVQAAKARHDLLVTGVYWRNELPQSNQTTMATLGSPSSRTAGERPQQSKNQGSGKSAQAETLTSSRKSPAASPEFEDTRIIAPNESGSPLSATQYGDLN